MICGPKKIITEKNGKGKKCLTEATELTEGTTPSMIKSSAVQTRSYAAFFASVKPYIFKRLAYNSLLQLRLISLFLSM